MKRVIIFIFSLLLVSCVTHLSSPSPAEEKTASEIEENESSKPQSDTQGEDTSSSETAEAETLSEEKGAEIDREEAAAAAAESGIDSNGNEEKTVIERRESEDPVSAFNYAFGVKQMKDLLSSSMAFSPSYFMRGMYDAKVNKSSPVLVFFPEFQEISEEYYSLAESKALTKENEKRPERVEDLLALPRPQDAVEKFSYVWGFSALCTLIDEGVEIDIISFMAGMLDELYLPSSPLTEDEILSAENSYIVHISGEYRNEKERKKEERGRKAEEFLKRNSMEEGVITLDDGVQILILDSDETIGHKPTQYATVILDYNEYVLDYDTEELIFTDAGRNEEISVINLSPGFQSALTKTHEGEAVRAFIPPELSGMADGNGDDIEPSTLFVYDIALQKIL